MSLLKTMPMEPLPRYHKVVISLLILGAFFGHGCSANFESQRGSPQGDIEEILFDSRFRHPMKFTMTFSLQENNEKKKGCKLFRKKKDLRPKDSKIPDFLAFMKKVQDASAVLTNPRYVQNDWDPFIRFIKAFKADSENNLFKFHESYQPKFEPKEDYVAVIIEFYKVLAADYPAMAEHFHFIPVHVSFDKSSEENLLDDWFLHRVAGAVKLLVDGRPWYLLVDPGLGLSKAVVLKDDDHLLLTPCAVENQGEVIVELRYYHRFFYSYQVSGVKDLILAELLSDIDELPITHLYDFRTPETEQSLSSIMKQRLLLPQQAIKGWYKIRGYFSFLLGPRSRSDCYFTMGYFDSQHWQYKFNGNDTSEGKDDIFNKRLQGISKLVDMSPEQVLESINFLKKEVFENKSLLEQILDLQEMLGLRLEEKPKSPKRQEKIQRFGG